MDELPENTLTKFPAFIRIRKTPEKKNIRRTQYPYEWKRKNENDGSRKDKSIEISLATIYVHADGS